MSSARKPYPSDVSDDESVLVAPYLTLLPEDAGQRDLGLPRFGRRLRGLFDQACAVVVWSCSCS